MHHNGHTHVSGHWHVQIAATSKANGGGESSDTINCLIWIKKIAIYNFIFQPMVIKQEVPPVKIKAEMVDEEMQQQQEAIELLPPPPPIPLHRQAIFELAELELNV